MLQNGPTKQHILLTERTVGKSEKLNDDTIIVTDAKGNQQIINATSPRSILKVPTIKLQTSQKHVRFDERIRVKRFELNDAVIVGDKKENRQTETETPPRSILKVRNVIVQKETSRKHVKFDEKIRVKQFKLNDVIIVDSKKENRRIEEATPPRSILKVLAVKVQKQASEKHVRFDENICVKTFKLNDYVKYWH